MCVYHEQWVHNKIPTDKMRGRSVFYLKHMRARTHWLWPLKRLFPMWGHNTQPYPEKHYLLFVPSHPHKVCPFWWYSHWNGNFNNWFLPSNLWRHQDGHCNSNCNGCCLPSNVSLKTSPWRHPDEHDKLSLFDDMGIGMVIQRIKMSFFLFVKQSVLMKTSRWS